MRYIDQVYSFEIHEIDYHYYAIIRYGNVVETLRGYSLETVKNYIYNNLI